MLLAETRTVAEWDGRYRITGLPPGEYLVVVLPSALDRPHRVRANAERRAPESSSATRPFFDPTLYPGVTSIESRQNRDRVRRHPSRRHRRLADAWRSAFSISGRIVLARRT